jgi:threonine/homoserine/homoserine lactone efflux protein
MFQLYPMTESLITMSITGLIVGFVFSMPIAGPISILITSNALKGRLRYCHLVTIGASVADFIYVFFAVFGVTRLYFLYKPVIPYLLLAGMLFLFYTGYKIIMTKVDLEHPVDKLLLENVKYERKGGFYTGFMINLFNPTLFIGWLSSSFLAISFVVTLGFNTGGLGAAINQNMNQINNIEGRKIENQQVLSGFQSDTIRTQNGEMRTKNPMQRPKHFHLLISTCYAFFLGAGSIIWFYILTFLIVRFRRYIKPNVINGIVSSLGIILCLLGLYFGFVAGRMLFISG